MTSPESISTLQLVVEKADDGGTFRVRCSLLGEQTTAEANFIAQLTEQSIFQLSYKMAGNRRLTRSLYYTDEDRKLAKAVGTGLFETLFEGDVERAYRRALEAAHEKNGVIRMVLDLTDAQALMNYPWEFLYDPKEGSYLARSATTSLVRLMNLGRQIAPKSVTLPLRVLVVSATPDGLPELHIDAEVASLRNATQDVRSICIDVLTNPTLAGLDEFLDSAGRGRFDVLHYIGHGGFHRDSKIGTLSFADEHNHVDDVDPDRFAQVVRNRGIQLVVLNACEGARTDIRDPYAGVAVNLLRARVPAVIAMQFEITDSAAIAFARALYIAVANGLPIDTAVSRARARVVVGQETLEWATPVLFLQAASAELFRVAHSPTGEEEQQRAAAAAQIAQREEEQRRARAAAQTAQREEEQRRARAAAETAQREEEQRRAAAQTAQSGEEQRRAATQTAQREEQRRAAAAAQEGHGKGPQQHATASKRPPTSRWVTLLRFFWTPPRRPSWMSPPRSSPTLTEDHVAILLFALLLSAVIFVFVAAYMHSKAFKGGVASPTATKVTTIQTSPTTVAQTSPRATTPTPKTTARVPAIETATKTGPSGTKTMGSGSSETTPKPKTAAAPTINRSTTARPPRTKIMGSSSSETTRKPKAAPAPMVKMSTKTKTASITVAPSNSMTPEERVQYKDVMERMAPEERAAFVVMTPAERAQYSYQKGLELHAREVADQSNSLRKRHDSILDQLSLWYVTPASSATRPIPLSRDANSFTAFTLHNYKDITGPTTSSDPACASGSQAVPSNAPTTLIVDVYASSGAAANCTASIKITTSDGIKEAIYVAVP